MACTMHAACSAAAIACDGLAVLAVCATTQGAASSPRVPSLQSSRRTSVLGRFAAGPSVHSASHSRATSSAFTPVVLTPCCRHNSLSCATVCAFSSALFASRADTLADVGATVARAGRLHRKHCTSALPKIAPSAHRRRSLRTHSHLGKPPRRATREQRASARPTLAHTHAHIITHTSTNTHVHSHPRSCKVCLLPRGPLVA